MTKINIHEAKTHLSRYAKRVKAGETILLCDRNVPFAEIKPLAGQPAETKTRPMGMDSNTVILDETWDSLETNQQIAQMFDLK